MDSHPYYDDVVKKVNPDIIIIDHLLSSGLDEKGIPYMYLWTANPLMVICDPDATTRCIR